MVSGVKLSKELVQNTRTCEETRPTRPFSKARDDGDDDDVEDDGNEDYNKIGNVTCQP